MAASPSRQQRRIRALVLAAALLVLGRVLDAQSVTALRGANQIVRQALDALDPFVVARDFYDRLFNCRYDWRFRCLCSTGLFGRDYPRGCVRGQLLWPFTWIVQVKFWLFMIVAKVPGIPDATLHAAKQVATRGPVAVGLGLLTAGSAAFVVLAAVAETGGRTAGSDELLRNIWSLATVLLLIPVVTGVLVFLLKPTLVEAPGPPDRTAPARLSTRPRGRYVCGGPLVARRAPATSASDARLTTTPSAAIRPWEPSIHRW